MGFRITYKEFIRLEILHQYFLDEGLNVFHEMTDEVKEKRMEKYDVWDFLDFRPEDETAAKIRGHHFSFRKTESGFSIWVRVSDNGDSAPFIALEDDIFLSFYVRIKDPLFFNYTDLPLETSRSVYYFSNKKTEENLKENFQTLRKGENIIRNHQYVLFDKNEPLDKENDSPIVQILKQKSFLKNPGLLGFIRIYLKDAHSDLDKIPADPIVNKMTFKNRKTTWRYFVEDRSFEKGIFPLTKHGLIPIEEEDKNLPNPTPRYITVENDKFYSDIFI